VGKSPGTITIRYNGITTRPETAGTYAVTFDVAAATGWNAANGLNGGTLTVNNLQTPALSQYTLGGGWLHQTLPNVTAITVTPNGAGSPGAVSNIRYAGDTTLPTTRGSYAVTFDVAAAAGWNPATLLAGNLVISQNPVAVDYTFDNLSQIDGTTSAVTIMANSGASPGAISNIRYNNSVALPISAGTYAVTFDVAAYAADYWNAASGLSAGTLTITFPTFTDIADFKTWLDAQPANNTIPYNAVLNVSSVGVGNNNPATNTGTMQNALYNNPAKKVSLDLSGSAPTSIEQRAFQQCGNLASVTIGSNVTSIGGYTFQGCPGLASVTFEGTITSFSTYAFWPPVGDLRDKYLATGTAGGIGTYTTAPPVSSSSVWTKQ
jgi:hypothetical protein